MILVFFESFAVVSTKRLERFPCNRQIGGRNDSTSFKQKKCLLHKTADAYDAIKKLFLVCDHLTFTPAVPSENRDVAAAMPH